MFEINYRCMAAAVLVFCVGCANIEAQTEQYGSAQPDVQCVSVSADRLYREYKQLDGKKLCVSGELLAHQGGVSLLPTDRALTENNAKLLRLDLSFGELLDLGKGNGDFVTVAGRFTYDKGCFGETEIEPGDETVCAPVQKVMYLEDIVFQS